MEYYSREWLDYISDEIENLLEAHHHEVQITGVQVSPRWIRFKIQPGAGTKISHIEGLSEELALVVEAPYVRVSRSGGVLAIEVPHPYPEPVHLLSLTENLPMLPPVAGILGLSMDGDPITLPLMAPEVTHALIAGTTGCGKTELLRSLILSLALYNRQAHLQIVLIDPKRRGFSPLEGLPHLMAPIATEPKDARVLLEYVVAEMERRDRENAPATPRIIIAVDEVSDLLTTGGKPIEKLLVRLAQRGRESGFHLLCSTQRPSADAIPGSIKANLPARLVGKVASAQEANTATGISGTNAERLRGRGDFLAVVGGQITRFQSAYVGLSDIQNIIKQLSAGAANEMHTGQIAPLEEDVYHYDEPEDES